MARSKRAVKPAPIKGSGNTRNPLKHEGKPLIAPKFYLPNHRDILAALDFLTESQINEDLTAMGIDISQFNKVDSKVPAPPVSLQTEPTETPSHGRRSAQENRDVFDQFIRALESADLDEMSDTANSLSANNIEEVAASQAQPTSEATQSLAMGPGLVRQNSESSGASMSSSETATAASTSADGESSRRSGRARRPKRFHDEI